MAVVSFSNPGDEAERYRREADDEKVFRWDRESWLAKKREEFRDARISVLGLRFLRGKGALQRNVILYPSQERRFYNHKRRRETEHNQKPKRKPSPRTQLEKDPK